MAKFDCLVINLERSPQRLERVKAQLTAQDIDYSRVSAVDGNSLNDAEVNRLYKADHSKSHYKELNRGEIGCYLSHICAWQTIVDRKLDFAIVLEDDVNLSGDLKQTIDVIQQLPSDWDYIKLAEYPRKRKVVHTIEFGPMERVIYNKVPARTCAQAVSLEGAKKLLAHSKTIYRPIDIDLQYWWEKDLKIYGLLPYPAQPDEVFTSDIDSARTRDRAASSFWRKFVNAWHYLIVNKLHTRARIAKE